MADKVFKGVVSGLYEREWENDDGEEIVLHSFKVESEKRYFRTGTTKPPFEKGDAIKFVANGKGNVDLDSVEQIEADEAPAPKKKARSGGGGGGGSRNDYWEEKAKRDIEVTEPRISYSAAQKNATTLVAAALEADILSFGQTAKGKKLDMLVDFVEETTLRLAQLQLNAPDILKGEE